MVTGVGVIHVLSGDGGQRAAQGGVFGLAQSQAQLRTTSDHFRENLVELVTRALKASRRGLVQRRAMPPQKCARSRIMRMLRRIRE
jgi:hypothetical protein